jgi:biopolymer transport protein ExbB
MSISGFFAAGGVVMWPLLVLSILAIALILERLIFWQRVTKRQKPVIQSRPQALPTRPSIRLQHPRKK